MTQTIINRPNGSRLRSIWGARLSAVLLLATSPFAAGATFLASDVTTWVGQPAGVGVNEAFLVISWADSQTPYVWGYRWNAGISKTGVDLLSAVTLAEPRLSLSGLDTGFIQNIGWNADLSGAPERFHPGYDTTTEQYWTYHVNNAQQPGNFNDGAAPTGAHILPALGSPFDEAGPGTWHSSNTGVLGRPLVNGSWDGFVYATFTSTGPGLPMNAPTPIPEPTVPAFCMIAVVLGFARRRPANC